MWRHDLQKLPETIGSSWTGIGGLIQQARHIDDEFTKETLGEVIRKVKERGGTAPEEFGFDNKADI